MTSIPAVMPKYGRRPDINSLAFRDASECAGTNTDALFFSACPAVFWFDVQSLCAFCAGTGGWSSVLALGFG